MKLLLLCLALLVVVTIAIGIVILIIHHLGMLDPLLRAALSGLRPPIGAAALKAPALPPPPSQTAR